MIWVVWLYRLLDALVVLGLVHLSFGMTPAGWLSALRRGEAVTLLPDRGGGKARIYYREMALVTVSLVAFCVLCISAGGRRYLVFFSFTGLGL